MMQKRFIVAAVLTFAAALPACGKSETAEVKGEIKVELKESTSGWRGNGASYYPDSKAPTTWSEDKNVIWSIKTDDWSNASPLIVGNRIFIMQEPQSLICLSAKDGKQIWKVSTGFDAADVKKGAPRKHKVNGYTTPTPVSDGQAVYVVNGWGVAAAFDMEGKKLWAKHLDSPSAGWGHSSSPILIGDMFVALLNGNLYGLSTKDGTEVWKTPARARWGSPVAGKVGDDHIVFCPNGEWIRASDGKQLATVRALNYNAPVVAGDKVYYFCGENGVAAYDLPKAAEPLDPKPLWNGKVGRRDRTYSSPIIHEGVGYVITRRGQLNAFNLENGERLFDKMMDFGGRGTVYPSLVLVGDKLFVSHDNGVTVVLKPGKKYEEIGRNELSKFRSTIVESEDRLFIRTLDKMLVIGAK